MQHKKGQQGFSLVELLIVVAIIGIIAAIAIPNLLASRRAANEGSAVASLRTLTSAQATYQATAGGGNFGNLTALAGQNLVDAGLGGGTKSGYAFATTASGSAGDPASPPSYTATAKPSQPTSGVTQSGTRNFFTDASGVISFGAASSTAMTAHGTPMGN